MTENERATGAAVPDLASEVQEPPSPIRLRVNGAEHTLAVPPITRLLDVLREELRLTGTKEGCGEGECGACSVLIDGDLVNSCLIPVLQAAGAEITTIEGLAPSTGGTDGSLPAHLTPIQRSFLQAGGAQCGICTPGMILAAHHLLSNHPQPNLLQIQEGLAGNLCRCTGYMRIFASVQQAAAAYQAGKS